MDRDLLGNDVQQSRSVDHETSHVRTVQAGI